MQNPSFTKVLSITDTSVDTFASRPWQAPGTAWKGIAYSATKFADTWIIVDKNCNGRGDENLLFGVISIDRCFFFDGCPEQLAKIGMLQEKVGQDDIKISSLYSVIDEVEHLFCSNLQPEPL